MKGDVVAHPDPVCQSDKTIETKPENTLVMRRKVFDLEAVYVIGALTSLSQELVGLEVFEAIFLRTAGSKTSPSQVTALWRPSISATTVLPHRPTWNMTTVGWSGGTFGNS